jgi:hypothetical protein
MLEIKNDTTQQITTLFQCAGFKEDQGINIIDTLALSMPQ